MRLNVTAESFTGDLTVKYIINVVPIFVAFVRSHAPFLGHYNTG